MTEPELTLRTATHDDFPAIEQLLYLAFGQEPKDDVTDRDRSVFEPERNHIIADGDEIVASVAAYTRMMTIPGGQAPVAHVTGVAVEPTHRRRGLLSRLMEVQLRDVRQRGEPIAALWASEGAIYQRYGYGLATLLARMLVDSRVRLPAHPGGAPAAGELRSALPGEAREQLATVYDMVVGERVGWSSRTKTWWDWRLADPPSEQQGMTALRALLHYGQSGPDGYALWRVKSEWNNRGPDGTVSVLEIAAATPAAYQALWRFLLSVDLTRRVRYHYGAVDEPLLHLISEPRQAVESLGDGLWVRLVDLPGALSARRYAAPVDVVIEVTDPILPENTGRWRLATAASDPAGFTATCGNTDAAADLVCDMGALGAAYLGGPSLASLAAAGRVRETSPGALAAATTAFGWRRAPSAPEIF